MQSRRPIYIREIDLPAAPLDVVAAWPRDRPLIALHSGRVHERFARWTILASPAATYRFTDRSQWVGRIPDRARNVAFTHDPLVDLDRILEATRIESAPNESGQARPFVGGWVGGFSYHLGGVIEPAAIGRGAALSWPLIELNWCPDVIVFDHVDRRWFAVGEPPLDELAIPPLRQGNDDAFVLGDIAPANDPDRYAAIVSRALRDIAAGDIFQANLAQHFRAFLSGSTRSLFIRAMSQAKPWYGACIESPDADRRCAISLSPELFLHADLRSGDVLTRPIKGTRPASDDPDLLRRSAKDAAELHMIIDLMRNDLGRVCEYGGVRVVDPRSIEPHPTVQHGVGEVAGRLRTGVTMGDLLRATFPPGSVTGAPKIRAMQIIEELEAEPREWYCGAIGCIGDDGRAALNVAIRTLLLSGRPIDPARRDLLDGEIDYAAGAGIVSDSEPLAEHRETLDKAAALRMIASGPALAPRAVPSG